MPLDPISLLKLASALTGIQMLAACLAGLVAALLSGRVRLGADCDRELKERDKRISELTRDLERRDDRIELLERLADRGTVQAERLKEIADDLGRRGRGRA